MSTTKHPVGPQASTVYRRRRLVVGLGMLAVIVIIVLIVVRPGSGDKPASSAAPAPSSSVAAPVEPAAPVSTACDPANVKVEAVTDKGSYATDENPELSLSVTNTGTTPCTLNAGTSTQVFTITSGADVYWKSTDCQSDPQDAEVTLEPGVAVSTKTPLEWDRTRSSPETCEITEREAVPGDGASYYLTVSIGGVKSADPAQFLLD